MRRKNILVIGGPGSLTGQLIRSFSKEGHRVSLLTGSRNSEAKYPRVFERYDFPYASENLPDVFESVSPDVTVFAGAYDSSFSWIDERRDSVAYVSAVMNILNAFSALGKGRFVCISSDAVFDAAGEAVYTEEDSPNAGSVRGSAFVLAESICRQFMTERNADIVIARLSGYYSHPDVPEDVDDFVSEFCVKYLRDGTVDLPDEQLLMPIFSSDAVFFLSKLALAPTHRHSCYHISSGVQLRVGELKEMIGSAAAALGWSAAGAASAGTEKGWKSRLAAAMAKRLERRKNLDGEWSPAKPRGITFLHLQHPQTMLDVQRFREEFGINRLADFQSEVQSIVRHMLSRKDLFLRAGSSELTFGELLRAQFSWLAGALVPLVENIICFVLVFLLTTRIDGSRYFARIDFYLLYVILFAIVYGQYQAILSAVLSTAGFLLSRFHSDSGVLLDYNTYVWIAMIFIVGLAIGYLRDRLSSRNNEAKWDHEHLTKQIDDVREINESNVRVKDSLHNQIINQDDSIGTIYAITSSLDMYQSEDVFFQAMDILRQIMGSDDIALYTVSDGPYARLFSATTKLAASLGNSIRYQELGELYEEVKEGRPYINRKLREDMPMMACAIREGEEIRTLIMIWKLPWEKMTLGQASILTVTSMLIQNSVLRANRYLDLLRSERFIEGTRILTEDAFSTLVTAFRNAEKRKLTHFTLLHLPTGGTEAALKETGMRAESLVRANDYVGVGKGGKLYVLLANTNRQTSQFAIERFQKDGIPAEITYAEHDEVAQ